MRRANRKSKKIVKKSVRFLGVNTAGLKSKLTSFKKVLNDLQPSVFFLEETKYQESGRLKIGNNFHIYELNRQDKKGGGLALGCLKELNPVWVREGNDLVEALSVEIFLKSMKIRCCVAYGPQENSPNEKKEAFWNYLDVEALEAEKNGSGLIVHFDGNLWAGNGIISGDPKKQNRNGKLFEEFLNRNPNLTVVNGLSKCKGLITRSRMKGNKLEESILDYFIVCSSVLPYISQMVIDDKKQHILTNYHQVKKNGKATDSDHFTQYMDLDLEFLNEKPIRQEIFNFKNEKSQKQFKTLTSETTQFTDCFLGDAPLLEKIDKWRSVLKLSCEKSFKKIRIKKARTEKISAELRILINKRNGLIKRKKECEKCDYQSSELGIVRKHTREKHTIEGKIKCENCGKGFTTEENIKEHIQIEHAISKKLDAEIEEISNHISDQEAKENKEKVFKQFSYYNENPEKIDIQKMWKMLKNVCPKLKPTLPCAKRNFKGKIITSQNDIKALLAEEYKNRLRTRPMKSDYESVENRRKEIFELKMKLSKLHKSKEWSENDLDIALGDLKNNKSRDFEDYANELFKKETIGTNLKKSLLIMFNSLKRENLIPKFMNYANVTTVPKSGSRLELKNERGIFRVEILRSILMRLIYNSKYYDIDGNISDCQMGARKGKGCRTNIWILNGIIHENAKKKTKKPIVLQFYDYQQMFDSVNLKQAVNDLFDYGVTDDCLQLLFKANEEIFMSVKTPGGLTDRQKITNSVLQGDTWGPMFASVQVDKICKSIEETGIGYQYKNLLPITMLGLVDDLVGVTEAGNKAQQMNVILNVKTSEMGLQFGIQKCKYMIIGNEENFINSNLLVDSWKQNYSENMKTGKYEMEENYEGKVEIAETSEYKYLGFIVSAKGDNMSNINALKKKSIGIIKKLIHKLDSMNLRKYYFEVAMVYFNVILRGSILYASETYYNLTEHQLRSIERIEEAFLRKILNTSRGCPISLLYLETGQWPARFQIMKLRMLFLKHILDQDEHSMVKKFFKLQLQQPMKGDWVSACKTDLDKMNINIKFEEIKKMTKENFLKKIKIKISEIALEYLLNKRGSKGKEILYTNLEMAEYFMPHNDKLNIEEKRRLFSVRSRMVEIADNFGKIELCKMCETKQDMEHIYNCKYLNEEQNKIKFEQIYIGNLNQQIQIWKKFEMNLERSKKWTTNENYPSDPSLICDPLNFLFSNG